MFVIHLTHLPQVHLGGELLLYRSLHLSPLLLFRHVLEHAHHATLVKQCEAYRLYNSINKAPSCAWIEFFFWCAGGLDSSFGLTQDFP